MRNLDGLIAMTNPTPDGIQPKIFDDEGNTPLHHAVVAENLDLCIKLANAGWHPLRRNARGESPIDLAQIKGYEEIVGELQEIAMRSEFNEPEILSTQEKRGSTLEDREFSAQSDFDSNVDPSEYHHLRNAKPSIGHFEVTETTFDPDAGDWIPPSLDVELEEGYSSAVPPKSFQFPPSNAAANTAENASNSAATYLLISESRLRALLEESRQSLVELFRGEKLHETYVASDEAQAPPDFERYIGDGSENRLNDNRAIREILWHLQDVFSKTKVAHPSSRQILRELEDGNLARFAELVAESLRHGGERNALHTPQDRVESSEDLGAELSKGKGKRRLLMSFFLATIRFFTKLPAPVLLTLSLLFILFLAFHFIVFVAPLP